MKKKLRLLRKLGLIRQSLLLIKLEGSWPIFGAHKQIVNRILEPYLYVTGIVSSTDWDNFFGLRDHPAAQPEIKNLAQHMREAIEGSEARLLAPWEWHLPYVTLDEQRELLERKETSNLGPSISAARCCRVSYLKQRRYESEY